MHSHSTKVVHFSRYNTTECCENMLDAFWVDQDTLYWLYWRSSQPITSQYPLETNICTHSTHKQCAIGIFFLRLLLRQLLLKLLKIRFLN